MTRNIRLTKKSEKLISTIDKLNKKLLSRNNPLVSPYKCFAIIVQSNCIWGDGSLGPPFSELFLSEKSLDDDLYQCGRNACSKVNDPIMFLIAVQISPKEIIVAGIDNSENLVGNKLIITDSNKQNRLNSALPDQFITWENKKLISNSKSTEPEILTTSSGLYIWKALLVKMYKGYWETKFSAIDMEKLTPKFTRENIHKTNEIPPREDDLFSKNIIIEMYGFFLIF